jgi:hypothetical protein
MKKAVYIIFVLLMSLSIASCVATTSYTTNSDGSVTEQTGIGPWVGVGTPWTWYGNNWYYYGVPYYYYGSYGWWPYGKYNSSYIVRNNYYYNNPHWNNWYKNNPHHMNQFNQWKRSGYHQGQQRYHGPGHQNIQRPVQHQNIQKPVQHQNIQKPQSRPVQHQNIQRPQNVQKPQSRPVRSAPRKTTK